MYWVEATTHQGASKKGFQHEPYRQCLYLFNTFLSSGGLQHFCVRDLHGALSMLPVDSDIHNPQSRYSRTVHITAEPAHIPLPSGYPMRWVSDAKPQDDWSKVIELIYKELSLKFKLFKKRRLEAPEEKDPVMDTRRMYKIPGCHMFPKFPIPRNYLSTSKDISPRPSGRKCR